MLYDDKDKDGKEQTGRIKKKRGVVLAGLKNQRVETGRYLSALPEFPPASSGARLPPLAVSLFSNISPILPSSGDLHLLFHLCRMTFS